MKHRDATRQQVKQANRNFYDAVADRYEELDGRRSANLETWLHNNLEAISQQISGKSLLDIGTGSGLVTRCAKGLFELRIGVDLSPKILMMNRNAFEFGVATDVDNLPFGDQSFDVVTCFAVLHHLYAFDRMVSEIRRVLKPGGIFYSDHDMEVAFRKRFCIPLMVYRKIHDSRLKYFRASQTITPALYALTEFQENGIDGSQVISLLEQQGFSVETRYHWYGLSPLFDKVFGRKAYPRGCAPLLSIVARKEKS